MKYLIILLISITSYSQSKNTLTISKETANKIVNELLECDGVKRDYILTKELLIDTSEKTELFYNILTIFEEERKMLESKIMIQEARIKIKEDEINELTKNKCKKNIFKRIFGWFI